MARCKTQKHMVHVRLAAESVNCFACNAEFRKTVISALETLSAAVRHVVRHETTDAENQIRKINELIETAKTLI